MKRPVFQKTLPQLYKLTSLVSGIDEHLVKDIVGHQFNEVRNFTTNPTKPRMTLRYLFTLEGSIRNVSGYIRSNLLVSLRKDPNNEELKNTFRIWWKYRQELIKFYNHNLINRKKLKDVYRRKSKEAIQRNNQHPS